MLILNADELADHRVPDVIGPHLQVLFCGVNPGLYSAATGRHFARPGNRFWPAMFAGGFTPRLLKPEENELLLDYGYGLTNVVHRPTKAEADLTRQELEQGGEELRAKVQTYKPRWLAVVGIQAYRRAFHDPKATVGPQARMIGQTGIWVLPNPSGLNAHYTPTRFAEVFRELHQATTTS